MGRVILGVAGLLVVIGCASKPAAGLHAPEKLTLYSLDGRYLEANRQPAGAEIFHGCPVLGKVEITDTEQREQLLAALNEGITQGTREDMAKCFVPRHGLRVVENGITVDYLLCFECSRFEEFLGPIKRRHEPFTSKKRPAFDKPLLAAGIPIAPEGAGPPPE
jgi:hypothetical protein